MRIFGFHDGHACGYYRILLPMDALRQFGGHEVETHCGWDERANHYPIVIGQRLGDDRNAEWTATGIWRRLSARARLVYETDDDIWAIDPTNFTAMRSHSPTVIDSVEQTMTVSHLITASTEPLARKLRQLNPNVVVLPNHFDGGLLKHERPRQDHVVVGWAGGDSHLRDIASMLPQLRKFLARNPGVEFHNIGTDYRFLLSWPEDDLRGLANGGPYVVQGGERPGRYTDWAQDPWDYYRNIDFDIGLAPLIDSEFNRSKSGIKVIEYGALGIPAIASDCEAYRSVIRHGLTGFLVRQEHEWGRYLHWLVRDRELRERMGRAAREHVAQWSIQRGWKLWEQAYQSLGERVPASVAI